MKKLILTVGLASIIASPAFAQSYDPAIGTGNIAAQIEAPTAQSHAQAAFARVPAGMSVRLVNRLAAVTPSVVTNASRDTAVRECSAVAAPYREPTWANFEIHQYRACMAQHGQVE